MFVLMFLWAKCHDTKNKYKAYHFTLYTLHAPIYLALRLRKNINPAGVTHIQVRHDLIFI